ncbi:TIGR03757 family integrating conjugative element protein [Kineobactrum sediminis]|uniref:TIGR03757 family integrating conjugative element protein n=1 Tax=Kineobactrum sediminis TaxID=1905677 RepID=A0A2N5Y4M3_9GAMM|nr:TIGR03757 family integrating conjugative element protein [Kineobactrum sediminis]
MSSLRRKGIRRGPIAGLLAILVSSPPSAAEPPYQVELFTTSAHQTPMHHDAAGQDFQLTVYYLDGLAQLNATLSHQLPPSPAKAKATAAARLGALTQSQQAQLQTTAMGLLAARRYGLQRYPAIVINGEAVTYGFTDPVKAIDRYKAWRARERS